MEAQSRPSSTALNDAAVAVQMERLGSVRDRLLTIILWSDWMFHERLAWSNRLSIRVSTVVDHQVKQWSRWQGAVVCGGLLPRDLLEQKRPPFLLSGLPCQEFKGRLPLAFAAFVTTMIMVKHDQM
jgi:hypothetical protein